MAGLVKVLIKVGETTDLFPPAERKSRTYDCAGVHTVSL